MQAEGLTEHMLIGEKGKVRDMELTSGITDILKENLLVNLATIERDTFYLFLSTSKKKENGYSFENLVGLIESKPNPELIIERSLDILLDSGIFSAKWVQVGDHFERRVENRNEIAEYFAEFQDDIAKGGDNLVEVDNKICERMLLKNIG